MRKMDVNGMLVAITTDVTMDGKRFYSLNFFQRVLITKVLFLSIVLLSFSIGVKAQYVDVPSPEGPVMGMLNNMQQSMKNNNPYKKIVEDAKKKKNNHNNNYRFNMPLNNNYGRMGRNSKSHKYDLSFYISNYQRFGNLAESIYNSLAAYSVKQSNGETSGVTDGYWTTSNYVSMKRSLRDAQRNMRQIREEASNDGYRIEMSSWETANVSF